MKNNNYILVIAIDKYQDNGFPILNNAKLDAERFVKATTELYGFQLVQEPLFDGNATRKNIIEALNHLSTFLTKDDNIIIYFAGHGSIHPKTRKGFWVPFDATKSISDYIPNSTVIDYIEGIEAKHVLLISDSCFAGTFLTQTRDDSSHYSKLSSQNSRWLLASGREESVLDGQPGVGSPFAIALNEFLEKNQAKQFSVSELMVAVSKETGKNAKQQPILAHIEGVGHSGGQMVFELINSVEIENDFDSDLIKIVVPIEIAEKLKSIGLPQKSMFGYYKENGKLTVRRFTTSQNFICSAYIFDEVSEYIPEHIDVKPVTYIAGFNDYQKLKVKKYEFIYAEVTYQRTGLTDTPYVAICRCKGKMVAFSITPKGTYNNLIAFAKNQATCSAMMLIDLFEEGKIKL